MDAFDLHHLPSWFHHTALDDEGSEAGSNMSGSMNQSQFCESSVAESAGWDMESIHTPSDFDVSMNFNGATHGGDHMSLSQQQHQMDPEYNDIQIV